jgi:hypothetical protein
MQTTELLTPTELAYILEITEYTLRSLVHSGRIPHTYIQAPAGQDRFLRFDPYIITEWMQNNPDFDNNVEKNYLESLKNRCSKTV